MRRLLIPLLLGGSLASGVTPSQYWRDYYSPSSAAQDGGPLPVGALVQAFDPDSVECGRFVVHTPGAYGYLHVYGDDPLTPEDEGALPGDTIRFTVDGVPYFTNPPAVWEAGDRFQYRADLYPTSSRYLTGEVRYGVSLHPISGVPLSLFGPTSAALTTDADGHFVHGPLEEGHYTVVLGTVDAEMFMPSITAFDAALILRHVLVGEPLPSPFEVADVSGNGQVSAYDASLVLQFIVGIVPSFPRAETLWVNRDSVTFDYAPGLFPTASFTVQVVGDVSGNWSNTSAKLAGHASLLAQETARGQYTYSIADFGPVYAVRMEIRPDVHRLQVRFPDDWLVQERWEGNLLHVAAAGVTPLEAGWRMIESTGPVVVRGAVNEGIPLHGEATGRAAFPPWMSASPNPFNPATTIRYAVPADGHVRLVIYDLTGRMVRTLVDEVQPAGAHAVRWDGRDALGRPAASGVYVCRLTTGGQALVRRMLLAR